MSARGQLLVSSVLALGIAVVIGIPVRSHAGAVITSGAVSMGINDTGELNFGFNLDTGLPFGIALAGVGDGISPGCLCEGWGVAVNGSIAGGASRANPNPGNLTSVSFSSTASTATSVVTLTSLPALSVTQAYAPSASSALFENTVTITNTWRRHHVGPSLHQSHGLGYSPDRVF
jgi:hypothetical protein